MQDFFAKTIDDFDSERVVNFDDDNSNNFAVYSDSVVIIDPAGGQNIVTEADNKNGEYVFENIDETISSLQIGDILTYDYDDQFIIVKISEIKIDGTTAVISADETSLDEVFDYVKVDETLSQDQAEFDTEGVPNVAYSDFDQIIDDQTEKISVNEETQELSLSTDDVNAVLYSSPKKADK